MNQRYLPVPEGLAGERLDVVVARMLGLSRAVTVDLIKDEQVRISGLPVSKSQRAQAGELIEVSLPAPKRHQVGDPARAVDLPIIHVDDDIVVVDKPVGVAAHASPGWSGPTVPDSLAHAGISLAQTGAAEREGIVHRLDVGTSGLMVVTRTPRAYRKLKQQFRDRVPAKTYHTLVQGHPDPSSGTIDAPIGRHPKADHRFAVMSGGRHSITHYDTIEAFRHASLLEVELETGRTHQIRVHFSAIKHPCCGDITYGADPVLAERLGLERQWLHAMALGFFHPADDEWIEFKTTYPADLAQALARIAD